jgi:hypothetical protein
LEQFGAPLSDLSREDLTREGTVFQIGVPPSRIDILTSITGVDWDSAWKNRLRIEVEGIPIAVLGKQELIINKRATGRARDLADLELLDRGN